MIPSLDVWKNFLLASSDPLLWMDTALRVMSCNTALIQAFPWIDKHFLGQTLDEVLLLQDGLRWADYEKKVCSPTTAKFCYRQREVLCTVETVPFCDETLPMKGVVRILPKLQKSPELKAEEINHFLLNSAFQNARLLEDKLELQTYSQKLEDLVEEKRKKLEQAEKMALVGSALATVIHDIKGPLSNVYGYAQLIEAQFPETLDFSGIIIHESERMLGYLNELLQFVRGNRELSKRSFTIQEFWDDLQFSLQPIIREKGIELQVHFAQNWSVLADYEKCLRVFNNLIFNALEALEKNKIEKGKISVDFSQEDVLLRVDVRDNARGIPIGIQHRLFEPFVTSGKASGTGLGLYIVKEIVEAHGGFISFSSQSDGTVFQLSLPIIRS